MTAPVGPTRVAAGRRVSGWTIFDDPAMPGEYVRLIPRGMQLPVPHKR